MTPEERAALKERVKAQGDTIPKDGSRVPSKGETEDSNFWDTLNDLWGGASDLVTQYGEQALGTGAGFAEGLTRGNTAPFMAGYQKAASKSLGNPFIGAQGGLLNVASNIWNNGEPAIDDTDMQKMIDSATEKAPLGAAAGNVAGAIAPYLLTPELGAMPLWARLASGTGIGAGEGALVEQSTGGDAKEGAKIGGVLGLAGVGGVEGLARAGRWAFNTNPGQKAAEVLNKAVTYAQGTKEFPKDVLSAKLAAMGPDATIADLPEYEALAKSVMYDPRIAKDVSALSAKMNERLASVADPKKALQEKFSGMVDEIMPDIADRTGNIVDTARTTKVITEDIRRTQAELSPQFDKVLDAVSTAKLNKRYLTDSADMIFRGADNSGVPVSPTEGAQKEMKFIQKRLNELSLNKVEPWEEEAWKQGVRDAKRMQTDIPPPPGFINPRDIQTLRIDINKRIGAAVKKGDRHTASLLTAYKKHLTDDILNEIPGVDGGPSYRELNQMWRSEEGYLSAAKDGQAVFSMKPEELADLPDRINALDDGDKAGFVEGFFRGMTNHLSESVKTNAAMKKVTDNKGFQEALHLVLPGPQADEFVKRLNTEIQLYNTATSLSGGQQQRAGAVASAALHNAKRAFDIGRIIGGLMQIFTGKGTSTISAVGGVQAMLPSGITSKTAEPLSKMLASSGPEAQSILGNIAEQKAPDGLTQQGLLDSMLESKFATSPGILGQIGAVTSGQEQRTPYARSQRR